MPRIQRPPCPTLSSRILFSSKYELCSPRQTMSSAMVLSTTNTAPARKSSPSLKKYYPTCSLSKTIVNIPAIWHNKSEPNQLTLFHDINHPATNNTSRDKLQILNKRHGRNTTCLCQNPPFIRSRKASPRIGINTIKKESLATASFLLPNIFSSNRRTGTRQTG